MSLRILFGLTLGLFLTVSTAPAADLVQWQTDYGKALAVSKEYKRPLFVHFFGDNCPPCAAMETEVFADATLAIRLNREFIPVKINVAEQPILSKQMSITAIPTDIVLTFDGQPVHRRQGGIKPERFGQYLDFLASKIPPIPAAPVAPAVPAALQPPTADNAVPRSLSPPITPPNIPVQPALTAPLAAPPIAAPPAVQPPIAPPQAPAPVLPAAPVQPPADPFALQPIRDPALPPASTATPIATSIPAPSVAAVPAPNAAAVPAAPDPFTNQQVTLVSPQETPAAKQAPLVPETLLAETSNIAVPQPPLNLNEIATATVEVPLALEGYCPVILNGEEKWVPGNPAFYSMFRGHIFRFSSADAMDKFMANPMKYVPMAMGEDVVQLVDRNKHIYGSRGFGAWYKERVFLFSSQESLDAFAAKPGFYTDIALKYETALKNVHGRY